VLLDSACAAQPARGGAQLGGGDRERVGGEGVEMAPGAKVAPGAACFATFFPGLVAQVPIAPRRRAPAPRAVQSRPSLSAQKTCERIRDARGP